VLTAKSQSASQGVVKGQCKPVWLSPGFDECPNYSVHVEE
jgi:hypothetical protein